MSPTDAKLGSSNASLAQKKASPNSTLWKPRRDDTAPLHTSPVAMRAHGHEGISALRQVNEAEHEIMKDQVPIPMPGMTARRPWQ